MARTEEEQKALRKARNRRYYEKHKEEILEKNNQYKSEHSDDLKLHYREYNKTRINSNSESPDNAHKRWTERDRDKLFKMKILENKPVKKIAEELQRSEVSIRNKLINDRNDEMIIMYNEKKEYYDSFFIER